MLEWARCVRDRELGAFTKLGSENQTCFWGRQQKMQHLSAYQHPHSSHPAWASHVTWLTVPWEPTVRFCLIGCVVIEACVDHLLLISCERTLFAGCLGHLSPQVRSESGSVMITPEDAEAPFKLIRLIGRGGFGNVYLGEWDGERVAIKASAAGRPCFFHAS
jgi:hypothetical protein